MLHLVATSFLIGRFSMKAFLAVYISDDSLAFCQLLLVPNKDFLQVRLIIIMHISLKTCNSLNMVVLKDKQKVMQ